MVKEERQEQRRMECEEEEEEDNNEKYNINLNLLVEEHEEEEEEVEKEGEQPLLVALSTTTNHQLKSGNDENDVVVVKKAKSINSSSNVGEAQIIITSTATSSPPPSSFIDKEKTNINIEICQSHLMSKQQIIEQNIQEIEMSTSNGQQNVAMSASGSQQSQNVNNNNNHLPQYQVNSQNLTIGSAASQGSRYHQLVALIDELGKDIRPTYNGNRNCQERLKRGIVQARLMVRECMAELEKSRHQQNAAVGVGNQ